MNPEQEPIRVLYIDDEEHNLSAFKASFRRDYEIHIASSAKIGIELLEETNPHILVADQRMPDMSGVEFFEAIDEKHPDPIRILLTAYTSSQTVIDAVNKGKIDKYLVKPWNNELMDNAIQTGYSMYKSKLDLKKKNQELQKTNNELNRFVYSVSHDLRAPLMSLLGLINLAKMDVDPTEQKQFFDMMETSVKKMDTYIQTTLDYYRNFKSTISIAETNVKEMATELIAALAAYNDQVSFRFDYEGKDIITTDPMRLKIILSNLLSNAAKYGRKDDSKYDVDASFSCDDKQLKIKIQDYGVGIEESEIPNIYNMFYRGPNTDAKKSTGLGLYLVKEAVERIGGEITVSSALGDGTEFDVIIPNKKDEPID